MVNYSKVQHNMFIMNCMLTQCLGLTVLCLGLKIMDCLFVWRWRFFVLWCYGSVFCLLRGTINVVLTGFFFFIEYKSSLKCELIQVNVPKHEYIGRYYKVTTRETVIGRGRGCRAGLTR